MDEERTKSPTSKKKLSSRESQKKVSTNLHQHHHQSPRSKEREILTCRVWAYRFGALGRRWRIGQKGERVRAGLGKGENTYKPVSNLRELPPKGLQHSHSWGMLSRVAEICRVSARMLAMKLFFFRWRNGDGDDETRRAEFWNGTTCRGPYTVLPWK